MYYNQQDILRIERRVVFYARVSTEHEAQISALENQIDWYKPIMAAHPEWKLVGQYIDEGVTGTSAEKREAFMQMIADAKAHKFDLIITREVSRFARNTVDTLQYTRELRRIGVEVFFLNDNIKTFDGDGELRLTIMATLAQDESRKTSIRVKSGQQTSMDKGIVYGNGNILGYKRIGKEMVIDPEQAKTVRLIYDLYLAGNGLTKIKYELEERRIKTAMGKRYWAPSTICGVLKNTFYHGVITYHKEYVPDFLTQKKIKNKGELNLTQTLGTHETIVTKEEYERVQAIMNTKRKVVTSLHNNQKRLSGKTLNKYVWGKLLVCSCGYKFGRHHHTGKGHTTKYAYTCYKKKYTGSIKKRLAMGLDTTDVCLSPTISEIKLEIIAAYILNKYINQKEEVLNLAKIIIKEHMNDSEEVEDNTAVITSLTSQLDKTKLKINALVQMRAEGEISKDLFLSNVKVLESTEAELQVKIAKLTLKENVQPTKKWAEKLEALSELLNNYTDFNIGRKIPDSVIEAFIKKIVVFPDHMEWHLRLSSDDEDPIKSEMHGNMKSGFTATLQRGSDAPFSTTQPRLLLSNSEFIR